MRLVFDRRIVLPAISAAAVVICVALVAVSASLRAERDRLKARQKEMVLLKDEYLLRRETVSAVEGRRAGGNITGAAQAVDEVFRSLGLNQKVKSVKSAGASDQRFGSVEEAEVLVEKVNMNELVNILYKIEEGPLPLTVRKAAMRTSFENPALLNLTLTVGLIRPR